METGFNGDHNHRAPSKMLVLGFRLSAFARVHRGNLLNELRFQVIPSVSAFSFDLVAFRDPNHPLCLFRLDLLLCFSPLTND